MVRFNIYRKNTVQSFMFVCSNLRGFPNYPNTERNTLDANQRLYIHVEMR